MPNDRVLLNNVNKTYKVFEHPRDRLKEALHPFGKKYHEPFVALRDINLTVSELDKVAVIGANGSGKSTLLKIVAGVLKHDSGQVRVNGSLGAILELGAAFHNAYTGTENVYHYAAVMGVPKDAIDAKYEEIKAFAGLGEFIDRPLKTYSNGMRARLAFAVSIHIDPDVLILDEVLSVGDISFRRKCFRKMEEFFSRGKAIIYVSHDMGSVAQLCNRAVLLDERTIVADGPTREVITEYQRRMQVAESANFVDAHCARASSATGIYDAEPRSSMTTDGDAPAIGGRSQNFFDPALVSRTGRIYGFGGARISNVHLMSAKSELVNILNKKEHYIARYEVDILSPQRMLAFGLQIKTDKGLVILASGTHLNREYIDVAEAGDKFSVEWRFQCLVQGGLFYINCGVTSHTDSQPVFLQRIEDAFVFKVPFVDTQDYSVGLVPMLEGVAYKKI